MTHIWVGNLTTIGPDNGLSPGRRPAIISTNAGTLLIRPWGTNFSEILIGFQAFSFNKMHLKMSYAKWRPFCLGLNVLTHLPLNKMASTLADDIFYCIFLNENNIIAIRFSLKFVPRSPIDNNLELVQVMTWRRAADKPLPEPMLN